jgi:hypothetical protein
MRPPPGRIALLHLDDGPDQIRPSALSDQAWSSVLVKMVADTSA